ncbi:MAG: radical SAM family heme chaperone HemW [Nitrospira sp.]
MSQARQIGLYIHVPLCRQRCHFCAFYLEIATAARVDAFLSALRREAALYQERGLVGTRALQTIYFGGGTPTALAAKQLTALIDEIRHRFPVSADAEITVEAHPSTITHHALATLRQAGVTRISFGAESMAQEDFLPIGRPGTVSDTGVAVKAAREAGFTDINLDLMYGLPGQTVASWRATLRRLLELEPTHISCYALTVEPETKFAQEVARGTVPAPNDDLQIEMESATESMLDTAGLTQYEISNYARTGFACRHNRLYWTDQDYLGLGPSAQSYVDGVRFGNVADLEDYAAQLRGGTLPVSESVPLSPGEQRRDALIFGLRLVNGVSRQLLHPDMPQQRTLARLSREGLIECADDRIRLTPLGRRFADTVAEELY